MGPHRAREVIEALLQGRHPVSGAALATEPVLQETSVLRALLITATALKFAEQRAVRRALLPSNVGRVWTTEEEARLREAFARKSPVDEIARAHRRTARAICQRLLRLGLLSVDSPQWVAHVGGQPLTAPPFTVKKGD